MINFVFVIPLAYTGLGYSASSQCYECVADHYGRNCTSCPPCDNGVCDTGFSGVGGCTCNVGWQGN